MLLSATDIDELFEALGRGAAESDDDGVSLLDHGLQTAGVLSQWAPTDGELQVAGLLHDIGAVLWPGRPQSPWIGELLTLRRADDSARVPDRAVPELESWRPTLEWVAEHCVRAR
jgi:predicted HD phosphohydrolase